VTFDPDFKATTFFDIDYIRVARTIAVGSNRSRAGLTPSGPLTLTTGYVYRRAVKMIFHDTVKHNWQKQVLRLCLCVVIRSATKI